MSFSQFKSKVKLFGKLNLLESTYTRIETRGKVIEAAVIDGYQNTPASKYHEGVDVAFMRYHSDELKIPDGFYKLHIKADSKITAVGKYNAISELINGSQKIVFSCPHQFDVTSVELPKSKGNRDVAVQINSFAEDLVDHKFSDHLEFTINFCCTNGTCGTCIGPKCPQQ